MFTTLVSILLALAKAVPALAGVFNRLADMFAAYDTKKNQVEALERRDAKRAYLDDRMRDPAHTIGLQPGSTGTPPIPGREGGGPGVDSKSP